MAWLVLAATLALLAVLFVRIDARSVLPPEDFCEYWAAGRLNAQGRNPYSGPELLPLENSAGWDKDYPVYMYNPPWTLTFVMPIGQIGDYYLAQKLWLLMNLVIIAGCADAMWLLCGGQASQRWAAWAVALLFTPVITTLRMGQIPPLILLGITGFLVCQRWRHDLLAGAFLVLTAIKPHLVYLVGPAVLLWVWQSGRWRVLLGGAVAFALATFIPWAFNPPVFQQYRECLDSSPPTEWITTTFGTLLRAPFGGDYPWLQFVPPALGLAWLGIYWRRHGKNWDWIEEMPLLLLVSIVTTFFAWLGDQVVLVPAVVCGATLVARSGNRGFIVWSAVAYGVMNGLIHVLGHATTEQRAFLWVAPALLVWYLVLRSGRQEVHAG